MTEQLPAGTARSQSLRIRVSEAGQTRADLSFRAAAAEFLGDLVPPDIGDKLTQRGLDVGQIAAEAVAREFAPGPLFELTEGAKHVRVWLE